MRCFVCRTLTLSLAAVLAAGVVACRGEGAAEPTVGAPSSATSLTTPTSTAMASSEVASPVAAATPTPSWGLPRGDGEAGVLVLDYGPLAGWEPGRPGAARGALYPLEAGSGATLPGYEPFDLGQASSQVVSPDGRWIAVAYSETQNSVSTLGMIDLDGWALAEVEPASSPLRRLSGLLTWSGDSASVVGVDSRTDGLASAIWRLEVGEGAAELVGSPPATGEQWDEVALSIDGERLFALGHRSSQCCGIDVEGDPYLAVIDPGSGAELRRVELPGVVIGQQFEELFEGSEYNVLRGVAVVPSADGRLVYVVHADDDRVSVVDVEAGAVRTEAFVRPATAFSRFGSRFGSWVTSQFVSRAEAKGGVYQRRAGRLSADGTQLYVTGIADIVCEDFEDFACVSSHPAGLQVVDLASMEVVAEYEGVSEIVTSADGRRVLGFGWEFDYREVEPGASAETVGFGALVIDARSLDVVARVEPETRFTDAAISPDGRWGYLVSDGPGVGDVPGAACNERCSLLKVIDLESGEVVAERTFDGWTLRLVGLSAETGPWG